MQVGPSAADTPDGIVNLADELIDFGETAAVISALDLVITVDTAAAHLAASLGKPVWLLVAYTSDWRWMLHREDTPWYPSMKIFRQKSPGEWAEVIDRVVAELTISSRIAPCTAL
jgi:ADP-heptose:LPS heptosyltransferase